jgi:hypothetical protein
MQVDIGLVGIVLGLVATVLGIYSSIRAVRTEWALRQIRKEELMTNIEITDSHTQRTAKGTKLLEASAIFRNIGRMNLMIEQISIEFVSKSADLKLNFDSLKFSHERLKFYIADKQGKTPYLYFNISNILKTKSKGGEWGLYFDPQIDKQGDAAIVIGNPYFLHGLQMATGEVFAEDYIIEYEGSGLLEVEVTITSFKRERKPFTAIKEWLEWWIKDPAKYLEEAKKEAKELEEAPWKEGLDRKIESFLIFLE